jgi:hypothetical protein
MHLRGNAVNAVIADIVSAGTPRAEGMGHIRHIGRIAPIRPISSARQTYTTVSLPIM